MDVLSGALRNRDGRPGPWGIIGRLVGGESGAESPLFYVSEVQGAVATEPSAASDGAGRHFVAWQTNEDADGWQEIRGQWLDSSGSLDGPAIRVSPVEERDHLDPSVAVDSQGNVVVTWTVGDSISGALSEIWAQAIDRSGMLSSAAQPLATGAGYDHSRALVAADPSGRFTLAWVRRDGTEAAYSLVSRRFDRRLRPLGAEVELTSGTGLSPWVRPIGVDREGRAEVRWEERRIGGGGARFLQRLDRNGQRAGGVVADTE